MVGLSLISSVCTTVKYFECENMYNPTWSVDWADLVRKIGKILDLILPSI